MSFEQSTMSFDCPMPFYTPALHPPPTCTIIWLTVIPLHPLNCFCSLCGTVFRKVIRPLWSSCTKLPTPLNTPSLSNMWQLEPKSYRIKGSLGTQMIRLPLCVCVCVCVCVCTLSRQCLTLCDPMDYSPPGSSVHGIFPGKNTGAGCHFLLQKDVSINQYKIESQSPVLILEVLLSFSA